MYWLVAVDVAALHQRRTTFPHLDTRVAVPMDTALSEQTSTTLLSYTDAGVIIAVDVALSVRATTLLV